MMLSVAAAMSAFAGDYTKHAGLNCYHGHGGANIDNGGNFTTQSVAKCEAFCDATPGCFCIVSSLKNNACWRRSTCVPAQCQAASGEYDTYMKPGAPPLPPTPPRPYPDRTPLGPPCAPKDCPNIVFSITDDQDLLLGGWENHGPTNPMRQTQQLIAAAGATLTHWRIHTPVCSPSRSELVSGRYFHNIKSNIPVPVTDKILYAGSGHVNSSHYTNQTFGVHLRRRGYQVGLFGKGNFNTYEGFDRWFQGATLSYGANHWEDDESPDGVYVQKKAEYPTALLGNKTIEWLQRPAISGAAAGRPFFAYFASHCPHFPATPAHWYADACAGTTSVRTPNFNHTNSKFHALVADQPPLTAADATLTDQLTRQRCQCLLSVDDAHAAILRAVQALESNMDKASARATYFVFSSDHGYNLGGHRLTSEKMALYEHTLRIPMVVAGPGIPAGARLSHLGTVRPPLTAALLVTAATTHCHSLHFC
jgi:arylsulfatase A-like enzyme